MSFNFIYNIYHNKRLFLKNADIYILFAGTKECYSGPLHLVESIRIALGNTSNLGNHDNQSSSSESENPGDKPLNNKSVHTKDTSDVDSKNDTNTGMQRQKMPQ